MIYNSANYLDSSVIANDFIKFFNIFYINNNEILHSNIFNIFYFKYIQALISNNQVFLNVYLESSNSTLNYNNYIYSFGKTMFKINLLFIVLYYNFFILHITSYVKQLNSIIQTTKLFLLNESEKEVGPTDDVAIFVILFLLILSSFIFTSINFLILQNNILI